jgi:hypothetical protein
MAAHDLADAPPDTIARHRAAERFFDAEAETALRRLVSAKKDREVGTRPALSGAVHGVELAAPHQPRVAREFQASRLSRA